MSRHIPILFTGLKLQRNVFKMSIRFAYLLNTFQYLCYSANPFSWCGEYCFHFNSFQSLNCAQLFTTPWTVVHQASLSITNSRSLLKLMSIELVTPLNHLILCLPLLLLPSIFPSIRVFSNKSVHHIRWPKYWEFQLQYQSFQ